MNHAEAAAAVVEEARQWQWVREAPANSNRGTVVDFCNLLAIGRTPQALGQPWCASFVHLIGRMALGRAWPVPRTASVQQVVEWAKIRKLLFATPQHGDLMVLYYPSLARFAHIGVVEGADGATVTAIEGNTNDGGSREGWGVFQRTRQVTDHVRFVHWVGAL